MAEASSCRVHRWEKPEGDLVKVNCDATYNPGTGNGGWGCILRDSAGDVVLALRGRTEALLNALHGELIACIQGTQAAVADGVGHMVIKTDAISLWCRQSTLLNMISVMCSLSSSKNYKAY
jgi:ribonuclease HI